MVATAKREGAMVLNPFALHRELPNDNDAVDALLSCCMLDSGAQTVTKCLLAKLGVDAIYEAKRAMVFGAILDLYSQNKPTDISMVADLLKSRNQLEPAGGIPFLLEVSQKIPTSVSADHWIERVKEQATRRLAIRELTGGIEDCYTGAESIDALLSTLEARMDRVSSQSTGDSEETVQDAAETLLEDLKKPKSERNGTSGLVSWGLRDIDERCGMMAPGDLIILAGMPSSGKSALADQCSWANAIAGRHVVMFSLEMKKVKKVVRIAQQASRLNLKQFDDAPMDKRLAFTNAVRAIKDSKTLHIYERDTTLNRVKARCRAVARRNPVGLIVVDFLQYLARLEPNQGKERSDEKVGRITAGLKELGSELNCPVLLLSSLNREGYKDGATPTLANLKASGEIESDADVVGILHWPKTNPKTGQDQDPHDPSQNTFYATLNQDKGRDNGVAQVPLCFTRTATRFDCLRRE
jgi:replicative DNA helicase